MDAFQQREADSPLKVAYAYWQLLKPVDGMPGVDRFDPKRDLPKNASKVVSWVDVRPENPMRYVFWDHLPSEKSKFGQELSGKTLEEIKEFGLGIHILSCAVEYAACKRFGQPCYHEIDQYIAGERRKYTRLLLPVCDSEGSVVKLFCAYRMILRYPK